MQPILVQNLSKTFAGFTAVNTINFSVDAGQIVALLGSNGAGKTTTMMMLLGISLPSSGSAHILGHDMATHRFAALPDMNFSSPYVDLPPALTAAQNLSVYGDLYGVPHLKARIDELAVALQFKDFLHKKFGSLSAGQKTRVSLAKALLNKPKVLLLDEPTASLDPDSADWVRNYLKHYQQDTGASILMASHNMQEVERMAHHVLLMHKGKIMHRGTVNELYAQFNRTNLEAIFLDVVRETGTA
ncbi:MAG: ABC transporter ATP-binding protein [Alphaproteobacteria bacterium]|nr:ABC transporter ATP-binding protein [Alphaproteobacteria bacterium]